MRPTPPFRVVGSALAAVAAALFLLSGILPGLQGAGAHTVGAARPVNDRSLWATHPVAAATRATISGNGSIHLASVPVGTNPSGAAVDLTNGWVYIANAGSANVSVINGTSLVATIPVGLHPWEATFDPANGFVYVANRNSNNISVIDGTSVVGTVFGGGGSGGFSGQGGVTVDPVTGYVYVANIYSGNVSVIDGTALVGSIPVAQAGEGPDGVVADPRNGYVYVANDGAGTSAGGNVSVINGTTVLATVNVSAYPVAGAYDPFDGSVYVICPIWNQYEDSQGLAVTFVGTSGTVAYLLGVSSYSLAVDSIHGAVYVTNWYSNTVSVLNGTTGGEFPVGDQPEGVSFDPLDGDAYVANSGSSYVSVVNATSTVGSIPVGTGPVLTAFDPVNGYVYVLNSGSANLTVLEVPNAYPTLTSFGVSPSTVNLLQPTTLLTVTTEGAGNWSYAYTGLPGGCPSANSAILPCTPSQSGVFSVQVHASNSLGIVDASTVLLTVLPGTLAYFTASPSTVEVGSRNLSTTGFNVLASGGVGPLSYRYTGLPGGCSSSNSSSISCTPTAPGTFAIRIFVNDSAHNVLTAGTSLTVLPALTLSAWAAPGPAYAGTPLALLAFASGRTGPDAYAWEFGDGTGSTSQNPEHAYALAGSYQARAWANDSFGGSASVAVAILVENTLRASISVSNSTPDLGQSVAISVAASGGATPYSYAYLGLPSGCVASDLPSIRCALPVAGVQNPGVIVTDAEGATATASAALLVVFDFTLVGPATVPVDQPLTLSVSPAGEVANIHYSYSDLPPGCRSADTSTLTCTPTAAGAYPVSVLAQDYNCHQATHELTVEVVAGVAPPTAPPRLPPLLIDGVLVGVAVCLGAAVLLALRSMARRYPPHSGAGYRGHD